MAFLIWITISKSSALSTASAITNHTTLHAFMRRPSRTAFCLSCSPPHQQPLLPRVFLGAIPKQGQRGAPFYGRAPRWPSLSASHGADTSTAGRIRLLRPAFAERQCAPAPRQNRELLRPVRTASSMAMIRRERTQHADGICHEFPPLSAPGDARRVPAHGHRATGMRGGEMGREVGRGGDRRVARRGRAERGRVTQSQPGWSWRDVTKDMSGTGSVTQRPTVTKLVQMTSPDDTGPVQPHSPEICGVRRQKNNPSSQSTNQRP